MATTNPHERYARTLKASKLALAIQRLQQSLGSTKPAHELAERLTENQRRAIEIAAGVKQASATTWTEVVRLLAPSPASTDDPFEDLVS